MKKKSCLLFVLWIVFSFSFSVTAVESSKELRYLGMEDADRVIDLGANEIAVIELEANYSTGYSWNFQALDSDTVTLLGKKYVYESDQLGAVGKEQLFFKGVGIGTTEVILEYMQPNTRNVENVVSYHFNVLGAYLGTFEFMVEENTPQVNYGDSSLQLPSKFNWCDQGGCTPVRDQGNCGSCWAFATVGIFESAIMIKDNQSSDLSEQYLVSCNSDNWGCDGGWFAHDYHVNKKVIGENEAGAVKESVFPYQAVNGTCNSPYTKFKKLESWQYVSGQSSVPSVNAMKQAIQNNGPLAVAVCANTEMQNYRGGIFSGPSCKKVNHAVILTGWDDAQGVWYLRNSWGTGWGESGYMRIKYGICEIGYGANYVNYGGGTPPPPPPAGGCKGYCGNKSPDGCWCDNMCDQYGDCCSDKKTHCG